MPLTIGFDATAAARQAAGIGRYTRHLLAALAVRDDPFRYRLYYCSGGDLRGGIPPLDARFRVRPLPLPDRVLNAALYRARLPLPIQLVTGRFDVFHSPDFTVPPTLGRPSLLTIHDLAFLRVPECAYPSLQAYLRAVVPRAVQRATRIIAVSENTRRDILELLGTAPDKVVTIPEGVDPDFRPPLDNDEAGRRVRLLGIDKPFILSVSTLEPRKNYVRLLEAFACLRGRGIEHTLVIAGARGWLYEPIYHRVRELGLAGEVRFLTPGDADLVALYGCADVFVYASLYEGFGLPPLEAMACGTPTACSNAASLPEVVGDAAALFDPREVEDMVDCLWRVLTDEPLRCRLRRDGPGRAGRFTWEATARRTASLYRDTAGA